MAQPISESFSRLTKALSPCNCQESRLENTGYAAKLLKNWPKPEHLDNGMWSVGVTTAPRRESNLPMCLNSLMINGWLPEVFAEPQSNIGYAPIVHQNEEKLGAWKNWLHCASKMAQNGSKYVLIVQDDTVVVPGVRRALESQLDALNDGFVSLYLSSCQEDYRKPGIFEVKRTLDRGKWKTAGMFWGACAIAFKTEVLQRILRHPDIQEWRGVPITCCPGKDTSRCRVCKGEIVRNTKNGIVSYCSKALADKPDSDIKHIDTVLSNTTRKLNLKWKAFGPSAAQHVGKHSTIWERGTNSGKRVASKVISDWGKLSKCVLPKSDDQEYDNHLKEWSRFMGNVLYPISGQLYKQLNSLTKDKSVLEFGSGVSTWMMGNTAKSVVSIEQDGYVAGLTGALHKPLKDGWYDWTPEGRYDVILIDGPAHKGREGVLPHIESLLEPGGVVIVDDTHREAESELANKISQIVKGKMEKFSDNGRSWSIIQTEVCVDDFGSVEAEEGVSEGADGAIRVPTLPAESRIESEGIVGPVGSPRSDD